LTSPKLVEHFFRHEYGRLVAMLSRRVGVQHIEDVEDAVQSALMTAFEAWTIAGLPDNPSAWLYRVAHNDLIGEMRQRTGRRHILEQNAKEDIDTPENDPKFFLAGEVRDDVLRMLFVCCDDAIPAESQLVLALKTLCGFDIREIALRLFTSEANVYKRLARARSRLRKLPLHPGELTDEQYSSRLPAVNKILYLLFTEEPPEGGALSRCSVKIGSYSGAEGTSAATTPDRPPRLINGEPTSHLKESKRASVSE